MFLLFLLHLFVVVVVVLMAKSMDYRESLPENARKRYDEKIAKVDTDPYAIPKKDFDTDKKTWPDMNITDIYHFLIYQHSAYTREQFRSHKSLEAYKLFQDGWVKDVLHKDANGLHIMKARVHHSMRIREKLLEPWVIVSADGEIDCAHCTCMAGLGETCSHVAALLFAMETWTRLKKETTVTDVPAYWANPSVSQELEQPYKRIREINLQSANKKRLHQDTPSTPAVDITTTIPSPTKNERDSFFRALNARSSKSGILSITPGFSTQFRPKALLGQWPVDFSTIRKECHLESSDISEIRKHTSDIDITFSKEEAAYLEVNTRGQSNSPFWQQYRLGRLTASKIYSITHTDINSPAISVVKGICYPASFTNAAVDWGRRKEGIARKHYVKCNSDHHQKFCVRDSGLVINPSYVEFGASPDGIVTCDCCGTGLVEVKCPYSLKDSTKIDAPWLDGGKLKKDSSYYYQVQTQMFITDTKYCDFFVWTPHTFTCERIYRDIELWEFIVKKGRAFHERVILPELVSEYFSKRRILKAVTKGKGKSNNAVNKFCVEGCNGKEDRRRWIGCDGENCKVEWYHLSCLRMKKFPSDEKWLCPDCK